MACVREGRLFEQLDDNNHCKLSTLAVHCFTEILFLLQVEDIHFRLDSHFLERESETLKTIIDKLETDSIRLKNAAATEFKALWRFFYEG